jgi:hypothetical protein
MLNVELSLAAARLLWYQLGMMLTTTFTLKECYKSRVPNKPNSTTGFS